MPDNALGRSLNYAEGELKGLKDLAVNTAKGAVKTATDAGEAASGNPGGMEKFGEDVVGAAKTFDPRTVIEHPDLLEKGAEDPETFAQGIGLGATAAEGAESLLKGKAPVSEASETPAKYVYRGAPEDEVAPSGAHYDQASDSIEEARGYAQKHGGKVQRINLSKLSPKDYETSGGIGTPNLTLFTKPVNPEAVETVESHATPVKYSKDSNGITWAHNKDVSPNGVSVPDSIPEAQRNVYAIQKLKEQGKMAEQLKARLSQKSNKLLEIPGVVHIKR